MPQDRLACIGPTLTNHPTSSRQENTGRGAILWLLLRRFSLRHWKEAPWQSGLLVLILALGVAVYFSIRLANRAVLASFRNFTDLITEQSDWILKSPAGELNDAVLPELRRALGPEPVHLVPIAETTATEPPSSPDEPIGQRRTYQILGVDLIGIQNVRSAAKSSVTSATAQRSWFNQSAASPGSLTNRFWELFNHPRAVFISEALAREKALQVGGSFAVLVNEAVVRLEVAGVIPESPERPAAPVSMLVMNLPALQALSGRPDRIDRVEFILEPGGNLDARRAEVKRLLDAASQGRWRIESPTQRRESGEMMTRAFRLNLTILSLIALLVGLYLIFQALDGAVIRRRDEIGILRSLGVEEGLIRRAWLLEAAALGLVGGIFGAALGWVGAQVAVRVVGQTVNALYHATSAESAALTPTELLLAVALAVVAGVLAGLAPAKSAATTPPAQLLVRGGGPAPGPWVLRSRPLAFALAFIGVALALLPPLRFDGGIRFPLGGYGAALCWIFSGGIFAGELLHLVSRWLSGGKVGRRLPPSLLEANGNAHAPAAGQKPSEIVGLPAINSSEEPKLQGGSTGAFALPSRFDLGARSPLLRLAISQVRPPTGRHRLAAASLCCAVAMTAGMAILVGSFSTTMRGWIERTFEADLYMSSAGAQSASTDNRISTNVWKKIVARPDVLAANVIQAGEILLPGGPTMLVGADLSFARTHAQLAWQKKPSPDEFAAADRGEVVFVSESFTERFQMRVGDVFDLPTPSGLKPVRIAAVFADYGNERGSVVTERLRMTEWFGSELATSVILKLKPGVEPDRVRSELVGENPGLSVFTNSHIRREILRIFRQTFSITYALEFIGVTVAVIGLAMTLASLLLQRRNELTTLRALGMTHPEIARATAVEGLLTASAGLAAGLVTSLALGWLLIFVINKQTFGWTLQADLPVLELAALAALVLAAGSGVGLLVGRWGAALPADREE